MKNTKRWIAAALVAILLFNTIPGSAFANEVEDTAKESVTMETGELICGQEESEGHTHTDACYAAEQVLSEETQPEETLSADTDPTASADITADEENENQSVAADLQARIDALPSVEEWNALCEAEGEEFLAVCGELDSLCQAIQDNYSLDVQGDDFDPAGDYSAQCPLNLTKLIAILYPGVMLLESGADFPFLTEQAFLDMVHTVFGDGVSVTADNIVYVAGGSNGGEGQGNKGSYSNPYITLSEAMNSATGNTVYYLIDAEVANSYYEQAGYSVRITDYQGINVKTGNYDDWAIAQNNPAIIISESPDNAYLIMDANGWSLRKNIGFYGVNLKLTNGTTPAELYCNGNSVVFGGEGKNNFLVQQTDNDYYPTLFGGSFTTELTSTDLTVNGGTWSRIYNAGSFDEAGNVSNVTGTAHLVVNGKVDDPDIAGVVCSVIDGYQAGSVKSAYYDNASFIVGGAASSATTSASVNKINTEVKNLNNISITVTNGNMGSDWMTGDAPTLSITDCISCDVKRGIGSTRSIFCEIESSTINSFDLVPRRSVIYLNSGAVFNVSANNTTFTSIKGINADNNHPENTVFVSENWTFEQCRFVKSFNLSPRYAMLSRQDLSLKNCTFETGCSVELASAPTGNVQLSDMGQQVIISDTKQTATENILTLYPSNSNRIYALDNVTLELGSISGTVRLGETTESARVLFNNKNASYSVPSFDGGPYWNWQREFH